MHDYTFEMGTSRFVQEASLESTMAWVKQVTNKPVQLETQIGEDTLVVTTAPVYDSSGNYRGPMFSWDLVTTLRLNERKQREIQEQQQRQRSSSRATLSAITAAAGKTTVAKVPTSGPAVRARAAARESRRRRLAYMHSHSEQLSHRFR